MAGGDAAFFREITVVLLLLGCQNPKGGCPFQPLESKSVHVRTVVSVSFSDEVEAALSKATRPFNAELAAEIGGSLRRVTDEYRNQQLDTALANYFNGQIRIICGLYECVLDEKTGEEPQAICLDEFAEALHELRLFMAAYRESFGPSRQAWTHAAEIVRQITEYFHDKMEASADRHEREKWRAMLKALPAWVEDCAHSPDPDQSLEDLLTQVKQLESSY